MPNGHKPELASEPSLPLRMPPDPAFRTRLERIRKLPQTVRDVLFAEETATKLRDMVDELGLSEKHGFVSTVVGTTLRGDLHPNLFIRTLVQHHNIPQEKARELGHKIANELFAPVRDELVQIYRAQPPPWPEEEQRAQEPLGETQKAAPVSAPPPPQTKTPEQQSATGIPKPQEMPGRPQPQHPGPPPERYHIFPPPPPPPRSSWQGPPTAPPIPPAAPQMPPAPPSPPRPAERGDIINLREGEKG